MGGRKWELVQNLNGFKKWFSDALLGQKTKKPYKLQKKQDEKKLWPRTPLVGLEPTIFGSGDQRLIH